jgi:hypothetical protein
LSDVPATFSRRPETRSSLPPTLCDDEEPSTDESGSFLDARDTFTRDEETIRSITTKALHPPRRGRGELRARRAGDKTCATGIPPCSTARAWLRQANAGTGGHCRARRSERRCRAGRDADDSTGAGGRSSCSAVIARAARDGAQFIVATHSPILLACPRARIYSFDQTPIASVAYGDLEHVTITRDFLNDPGRFIEDA